MAHGSLSPAIRLLWFGARGPRRPGTAWIMPARRVGPLEFCWKLSNLAGLSHSEKCQDGASSHCHNLEQRSRLFVGQHVLQLVLFQESPESPSVGPPRAGRGTNINTKPPVNKAAGRVPATPEQVCGMSPCDCLASA